MTFPVFPITSSDSNNINFGTGFIVHRDSERNEVYLVTCAHVVHQVGGEGKVMVAGRPAFIDGYGDHEGNGIDLAVLRVDAGLDGSPLELCASASPGDPLAVPGFEYANPGIVQRDLSGRLGRQISLWVRNQPAGIPGWDLEITGRFPLQPGYSGSPVLAEGTGQVTAVVSSRSTPGDRGIAISIQGLRTIWDNCPVQFQPPPVPRVPTVSGWVDVEHELLLCNREMLIPELSDALRRSEPVVPTYLVLIGDDADSPDAFLERLYKHGVPIESELGEIATDKPPGSGSAALAHAAYYEFTLVDPGGRAEPEWPGWRNNYRSMLGAAMSQLHPSSRPVATAGTAVPPWYLVGCYLPEPAGSDLGRLERFLGEFVGACEDHASRHPSQRLVTVFVVAPPNVTGSQSTAPRSPWLSGLKKLLSGSANAGGAPAGRDPLTAMLERQVAQAGRRLCILPALQCVNRVHLRSWIRENCPRLRDDSDQRDRVLDYVFPNGQGCLGMREVRKEFRAAWKVCTEIPVSGEGRAAE